MRTSLSTAPLLVLLAALCFPHIADAQTGVSEDRVSLPEGPGSLEGVGENVEMDPNMGNMSYAVPIEVPQGFPAVTPNLSLNYSSGGGGSVVGMGWSFSTPSIERMTYRGLPEYQLDDDFAANGSDQLVLIPGSNPPTYRSRYEKGFVRHTWMAAGEGAEGYWIAEDPDGSRSYFGATADGTLVPEARMGTAELGTFRYMLVEKVDVYGHTMAFEYTLSGQDSDNLAERPGVPLVSAIRYGFVANPEAASYRVELTYQERMDDTGVDYLSDGQPGFNELLVDRLARIDVFSRDQRIRTYRLSYESYANSGGFTRLTQIEKLGVEGGVYPVVFGFAYSQALGGQTPEVVPMGSLGVSLGSGNATLLDINGDALPDVVDTTEDGAHRFFVNEPATDGSSAFDTTPITSNLGRGSDFRLSAPGTQILDVNGDGFSDILNAASGEVLVNRGQGDWLAEEVFQGTSGLADSLASDIVNGELQNLRFLDYNNDKRIDLMRSTQTETSFLENGGGGEGFSTNDDVQAIEAGFEQDNLQLADMNGDGLQDVVQVAIGQIRYRLNYGWGRWGGWVTINGLPIADAETEIAELEDLNGDGMADIVVVSGATVKYALNRNTTVFTDTTVLSSDDVNGDIPERSDNTNVLYADMNANGSSDIVWIDASGDVNYLELFPVRPNLLTRITNGIGQVTDITYSSSVTQMALDGGLGAWQYKLPHPMLVVASLDKYDLLTDVHEITTYRYHDGFYDGQEKQFRGYERVEMTLAGDASQEEGLTEYAYDVGATDTYRNGLVLREALSSGGEPIRETETTYAECDVAEVPDGTELPVKFICPTATRTTVQERAPESEWVVIESTSEYDGYGNVTLQSDLGVTAIGGAGCGACPADRDPDEFGAPCDRGGDLCVGDEMFTEIAWVEPGDDTNDRWIISAPYQERVYGREGSALVKERLTYYDGPDFEGMALGALDQGNVSRVTERIDVGSDDVIASERNAYDAHGNVIETIDPNGDPDGHRNRRQFSYDDDGLRVVRAEILLEDADGAPYRLRRDRSYEPLFDKVASATDWIRVVDGQPVSVERTFSYLYDEFGRMLFRVMPGGDTPASPTETYQYDLGNPTSRVITRKRSEVGGPLDLEVIACFDGRGRVYQTRTRLESGRYQVDGFKAFNVQSNPVREHQPYTAETGECDEEAPDTRFSLHRYDAAQRELEITFPDSGVYGAASVERKVYAPLTTLAYDREDTDADSPFVDTPIITHTDGLERVVSIERTLSANDAPRTEVHYDSLGRLTGYTDPAGNRKVQVFDLLDRVTLILDPNTVAETTYQYDDAGNAIRMEDDRGVVTLSEYDGLNRVVRKWDEADRDGTLITWLYDVDPDCDPGTCGNTEGKLVTTTWPGLDGQRGEDRRGYDVRNRPVYASRAFGGQRFETTFEHDNADRAIAATYPTGRRIENTFDDASRLTAIDGLITEVAYNDQDQLNAMRCANGAGMSVAYDDMLRPSELLTTGDDGDILQGFGYTYDRLGNILSVADLSDAPYEGKPSYEAAYTYDAWYRVTSAALGTGDKGETVSFAFDAIDNITAQTSTQDGSVADIGSYGYGDAPNAITRAGGVDYAYDPAGHMSRRGDLEMTWDFMGRMTTATRQGDLAARMTYGYEQSRVARQADGSTVLYVADDFEVRDGIATTYVRFDGKRVVRIEDASLATDLLGDSVADGEVNAADAFASRGDDAATGQLWSSVRRLLVETGPADGATFLHVDHLRSVTLATASDGDGLTIEGERAFYPLGAEREAVGYVDEYGFTGQEIDRATGLLHFDWRYYDPRVGRWLSVDPAFGTTTADNLMKFGEATTAYNYVAGNFINAHDPTGLGGFWDTVRFIIFNSGPIRETIDSTKKHGTPNNPNGFNDISQIEDMTSQLQQNPNQTFDGVREQAVEMAKLSAKVQKKYGISPSDTLNSDGKLGVLVEINQTKERKNVKMSMNEQKLDPSRFENSQKPEFTSNVKGNTLSVPTQSNRTERSYGTKRSTTGIKSSKTARPTPKN